ncbi:hypothetical protein PP178_14280 [Zeaxanthinibacter sp. PT1]|uniref:hypothetical protein n=1 Tax=Zeaxanthinibacter TaxID=561554 RepID=UPI0017A7E637|nr:hypothetical protein [Zeaxanthinibacter sp. PT1]MDC6352725.1 hypothetical protein [Zeaxanthinibacter sp. PT1]NNF18526.1 hypothetical protein [Flavobacteriaceae bacterium]
MDLQERVSEFLQLKMSHMSTSDRITASRKAKDLILELNEIYKVKKDQKIMDTMKKITEVKRKVEKRLKGRITV